MKDNEARPQTTPYRPSNGTCGEIFREHWCDRCHREQGARQCSIFTKTLIYDVDDPHYPRQWIQDDDGPRCTAFEKPHATHHATIRDKRQIDLVELLEAGACPSSGATR